MKAPQKFMSLVGAVALCSGMTFGVASAQSSVSSTSDMPVGLQVTCSVPGTIDLDMSGGFAPIDRALGQTSTSTDTGAISVSVDVGCYLGSWRVDAEVTRFQTSLGLIGPWFDGTHFSLEADSVTSVFNGTGAWWDLEPLAPSAPSVSDFSPISGLPIGDAESDAPIFKTTNIMVWNWDTGFDYPAPFTSTATYTGHLDEITVPAGNYSSTMTVTLTLED